MAEGKAEGRAEGEAIGIAKGETIGLAKGMIATAQRMKSDGLPTEKIAKYTQLSLEEIETL